MSRESPLAPFMTGTSGVATLMPRSGGASALADSLEADLFQRMIAVGARDELNRRVVREAVARVWDGRSTWGLYPRTVGQDRSELQPPELEALLRCMVFCEQEFAVPGGSVSAVKWVFRELAEREPDRANQLAGWIVDNRGWNTYIPWGRSSDARSFEEYELFEFRLARWAAQREDFERAAPERRARAKQEGAERQLEHRRNAETARPARQARNDDLLGRSDHDCVREVITADETADYWSASVAERCATALTKCSVGELEQLLSRAQSARADWWRALRQPIRQELLSRSG
jgi:hypothetical protein